MKKSMKKGPSMAVTVRIPTILRSYTGGSAEVSAQGATLAEVIEDLEANHPGLRARLLDDSGKLRRFVNVYVDDDDVRFADGLATSTLEGAKLSIIPAVAGGC
jgi:sulfur-carrier protein